MNIYEVLAVILTAAICGVLWKVADCIQVITQWVEHDLKVRGGGGKLEGRGPT